MVLIIAPQVFAEEYKVIVIPDNIVTESASVDEFIYNASSEFFADEVVNTLNKTDYISAPTVSDTRAKLKTNPTDMLASKKLTSRFRTSYNIDYSALKKITTKYDTKYALLITSAVDAENYVLRRTVWDFLNVPGASVIDPAYKISTYAVLVDTDANIKLWDETFYKTISTCENRIITRGPSPQTEQLQKIKDYSRYLCPQIARNIQRNILPADLYEKESTQIDYDLGNIDNVFTKKYRHLKKESDKIYQQKKQGCSIFIDDKRRKFEGAKNDWSERHNIKKDAEYEEYLLKLEEQSKQDENNVQDISNTKKQTLHNVKNTVYKKDSNMLEYCELINIEINKKKKYNLFNNYELNQPNLRNYN